MKKIGIIVKNEKGGLFIKQIIKPSCGGSCAGCSGCGGGEVLSAANAEESDLNSKVLYKTGLISPFLLYFAPLLSGALAYFLLSLLNIKEGIKMLFFILAFIVFGRIFKKTDAYLKKTGKIKGRILKKL